MTEHSFDDLLTLWDQQQSAYIASREARFDALMDTLALQFDGPFTLVELGCGPGSLTRRLLQRFPTLQVTALDLDPVMLAIARETLAPFGERVRLLSANLATPCWQEHIVGLQPDAVVSSTALHWLMPERQHALHREIQALLAEDGLFLNADHQRFSATDPQKKSLSECHDALTQRQAWQQGVADWDRWFAMAGKLPEIAALLPARERVFTDHPLPPPTTLAFQLASLEQAGFREHGSLWQLMDDYLIAGWK